MINGAALQLPSPSHSKVMLTRHYKILALPLALLCMALGEQFAETWQWLKGMGLACNLWHAHDQTSMILAASTVTAKGNIIPMVWIGHLSLVSILGQLCRRGLHLCAGTRRRPALHGTLDPGDQEGRGAASHRGGQLGRGGRTRDN